MTLSYWNQQFQVSRVLPDFQDYLAQMAARSDAVSGPFRRIAYGDHDRQFVEIKGTPAPGGIVPVFIHGGYWRALTADMHRFVLPALGHDVGAVANLEYRLLPEVRLADIVEDALAGLRCVAEATGCRLAVVGHSAGGHLALTGALRLPETVVAAVGVSGLYDLTPLQWSFLREEVGLTAADIDGHSPLALWQGIDAEHILLAVGAEETPEFLRQTHIFASTHGARVCTVPQAHHMTVLDALADPHSCLSIEIQSSIQSDAERRSITEGP